MADVADILERAAVGDFTRHPDFKRDVQITQIDGDMVAMTVWPHPHEGGCHRIWVKRASFGKSSQAPAKVQAQ